jgi:ligand-binding sensor domain-containing protein/two-component sensor histidine kinase
MKQPSSTYFNLSRAIAPWRLHWWLLLLHVFPVIAIAQHSGYLVETFGTRNGLLSPKIYSLIQTTDRKLWVGSELGISVFDGYTFKNFQYTNANENIGRILAIAQDSSGNVWFGGDNGLFQYRSDSVKKIDPAAKAPLAIESLLTDADGNLWVGDLHFLYKMKRREVEAAGKPAKKVLNISPYASLKERAFGLAKDRNNNVYMASHGGVYLMPPNTESYRIVWQNPDVNNYVQSVSALSADSIFWNRNDGHPMQMINGSVHTFFDPSFLGRSVFTHQNRSYAVTTRDIAELRKELIPIVSFSGVTNHAHSAIIDAEGNIWIGTWEGLQKFKKNPFSVYILGSETHSEIFSMLQKSDGELLFGGNRGIVYKKEGDKIMPHPGIPRLFKNAEVLCMREAADKSLWFGSGYQGISKYASNRLQNWNDSGHLKDNNCEDLVPADNGHYYACTELGVTEIDPSSASPMIAHYNFERNYSRHPELFGGYRAGNQFWFYGSQGLYRFSSSRRLLQEDSVDGMPVKNLYVNKIIADAKGNTWIATQGKGLLQCLVKNNRLVLIKQYNAQNGLPSDNALSVIADKNDNIWLGDYMSVSVLVNPGANEQLVTFNEKDGLLSTYYQTLKLEKQKNGRIWGLTTMGMFSFNPDSINHNPLPPVLLLEKITVSGDDAESSIAGNGDVDLSYKFNSLRFYFTAVSLSDPSKIRYAYRLKEVDSNWRYTNERVVNLNFLAPGSYTFELIASNNSNVWTKSPATYRFTILPPFWKTLWFRILAAALVAGLLYFIFKRRLQAVRAKAAIRQQMAELEGKALRAQMNPHFIFNSLNAIQKLIVVQDMEASYNYLSKFSKLLRLVLDNSDKNTISLSQELEMNKLYLELESLRFKNSFRYHIELNQHTDADSILIPSLLLQPFIENAIWHGLMHKEGEKKLSIKFTEDNNHITCTIEDNGIGREKSAAIKAQKIGAQYFNSKGTQLSQQRINLLRTSDGELASVEFVDLKNEVQEPAGTRVIIQIPLQTVK